MSIYTLRGLQIIAENISHLKADTVGFLAILAFSVLLIWNKILVERQRSKKAHDFLSNYQK